MPDAPQSHKKEQAKLIVACLAFVAVTIAVIATTVVLVMKVNNSQSTATNTSLSGELTCLPKNATGGPVTLECAIGLRTDDNRYYLLKNMPQSYSKPTGSRVTISGTLTPGNDAVYDVVGAMDVKTIQ